MRKCIVYKDLEHKREDYRGTFHQFGIDYEEFETVPGNFSTCIIEKEDGTLVNEPVENVKLLKTT